MGFRLYPHTGMFPASIQNGVIHLMDEALPPIQLPNVYQFLSMGEQCNSIINDNVHAYLQNDKYNFVLWEDGATALVIKANNCFRAITAKGSVIMPTDKYLRDHMAYGGLMSSGHNIQTKSGGQAYLFFSDNGKIYVIAENCEVIAKNVIPNTYYYHYRRTCDIPISPNIYYENGSLKCNAFGKQFVVECEGILNTDGATLLEGVIS